MKDVIFLKKVREKKKLSEDPPDKIALIKMVWLSSIVDLA